MAKILVIEDDEDMALVLERRLSLQGHNILVERSAHRGFSIARKEEPDLIILELMVCSKAGLNALEHIKELATVAAIPIIVVTALYSETVAQKVLAAGADAYIEKPLDFAKLSNLIRDLTKKSSSN